MLWGHALGMRPSRQTKVQMALFSACRRNHPSSRSQTRPRALLAAAFYKHSHRDRKKRTTRLFSVIDIKNNTPSNQSWRAFSYTP